VRRAPAILALLVLALAACGTPSQAVPTCPPASSGDVLILMAQSVPSAAEVPCIAEFPAGWSFGGQQIESGHSEFWLFSDRAGERAVTVTLTRSCDVEAAVEVPADADEAGLRRFEEPRTLPPGFSGDRFYVFPGGCIRYRFDFTRGGSFALVVEATEALSFVSRAEGVEALREEGLVLCGAGVSCPG
jgi:hypothetical protein